MIRVLIVEDSPVIAHILCAILNSASDIEVIGIARNGEQAVKLTDELNPNLITMDINLPKMNGYEATKRIMAYHPTPILVVTSNSYASETKLAFNAIYYGALDMLEKGDLTNEEKQKEFSEEFIKKVRLLSSIRVIHHPMGRLDHPQTVKRTVSSDKSLLKTFIVGIAASTGGPQIVHMILKKLPARFNFAVMLVQHIGPDFTEGFAEWLEYGTKKRVKIAHSGDEPMPGTVYISPSHHHMTLSREGHILLNTQPLYKGHRPSANLLFSSLAEHAPHKSIGVILSGMGADGLEGLKEMKKKNAAIIAQDEASCVVFGMPKVCIDEGIVTAVVPADKIADEIMKYT